MVSTSQQLIDVVCVGACRSILAQYREVGSNLAVKQGNLLQFGAGEPAQAVPIRLGKQ